MTQGTAQMLSLSPACHHIIMGQPLQHCTKQHYHGLVYMNTWGYPASGLWCMDVTCGPPAAPAAPATTVTDGRSHQNAAGCDSHLATLACVDASVRHCLASSNLIRFPQAGVCYTSSDRLWAASTRQCQQQQQQQQ